jgi:hypothetical protein
MAYEYNGDLEVDGNINVDGTTDATGTLAVSMVVSSGASDVYSSVNIIPETEFQAIPFPGTPDGTKQYLVSGMIRNVTDSNTGQVHTRLRIYIGQNGDLTDTFFLNIPSDFSDDGADEVWFRNLPWFILYTPEAGETVTLSAHTNNAADDAFWNVGSWVTILEYP